jgi:diacylglycerol kinase (ATP)
MTPYSPYKGKSGIKRIFNATGYSLAGFKAAFSHEAAFRQVLLLNLILIPISFFVHVSALEQALMVAVCLLAIIVELFNSAIEAVVDRISLEKNINFLKMLKIWAVLLNLFLLRLSFVLG